MSSPIQLSPGERLTLVLLSWIPFGHVVLILAPWFLWQSFGPALLASLLVLYALPPLMVRIPLLWTAFPSGSTPQGSGGFFLWWYAIQCQAVFNRIPMLEEIMRLVPGCYSLWLRLWGSRIGKLVYWGPGFIVLDRSFLRIGDRVVFGADVRVVPHLLEKDSSGVPVLILAPIQVENDSLVGASSLLAAGVRVGPSQSTPAFWPLPPFSQFDGNRRWRWPRPSAGSTVSSDLDANHPHKET